MLLIVDDPNSVLDRAMVAGASEINPVGEEHGWQLGRIDDPFGHRWESGDQSVDGRHQTIFREGLEADASTPGQGPFSGASDWALRRRVGRRA